jgi:hypothetical protein
VSISLSVLAFRTWSFSPPARGFLHVSDHGLDTRVVRVDEQSERAGLGNQLGKQLEPLGHQLQAADGEARQVAAWPGETGDQAELDRVGADGNWPTSLRLPFHSNRFTASTSSEPSGSIAERSAARAGRRKNRGHS